MERYKNIIGSIVAGTVDRPLGTAHPDYPDMIYPINYGYVDGKDYTDEEILKLIEFQEKYFEGYLIR